MLTEKNILNEILYMFKLEVNNKCFINGDTLTLKINSNETIEIKTKALS